jgi:hypothetical protein
MNVLDDTTNRDGVELFANNIKFLKSDAENHVTGNIITLSLVLLRTPLLYICFVTTKLSLAQSLTNYCSPTHAVQVIKMAEEGGRGGFGRGGGGRGGRDGGREGGRGRGRGRGGGRGGGGRDREENVWVPVTKLGRLVKDGKIGSIEEIFLFSLPVKEAEIIDYFLKDSKFSLIRVGYAIYL